MTIDYGGVGGVAYKTREVNPGANVAALVPFGYDGGKGVTHNSVGFHGFAAIPATVGKDRERVKELLRVLDYMARNSPPTLNTPMLRPATSTIFLPPGGISSARATTCRIALTLPHVIGH